MINIHPVLVHFPIAFLTIYALLEVFVPKKISSNETFWWIKFFTLWVGFLGSMSAVASGETAENTLNDRSLRYLVEYHASFAVLTEWIFGVLAVCYLVTFLKQKNKIPFYEKSFIRLVVTLSEKVLAFSRPLAFVGLIAVTVTGALGGAIVYGKDADPLVSFVYKIIIGN